MNTLFKITRKSNHILKVLSYNISSHQIMTSSDQRSLIAVCQMTATSNKKENFNICKTLIEEAKEKGAKMVFLPECFDYVGENRQQSLDFSESLEGPLINSYLELAKENNIWISLGGFHEKGPEIQPSKLSNAHVIINSKGQIANVYRKVHLFDVDIPGKVTLKESNYTIPGTKIVQPVKSPVGHIGLGICYDMRFPEFCLSLAKSGAEIITYPSAFTQTTGMAHWEPILRARAIESQCYVVAAAQTGAHNSKRNSYGHAMVVDPWGCVVACCREGTNLAIAEINLDYVKKIRTEMPVFQHRRPELYGIIKSAPQNNNLDETPNYQFGQVSLSSSQLFHKTDHSMAFVNKKPVVPGHVLVAPIKPVVRLNELSVEEMADLFNCVQKTQLAVEREYQTSSSTIAIQDGIDAGQTIMHLHVHILPRKPNDFKRNDDVYVQLENHESNEDLKLRNNSEMSIEANNLRKYFVN